MARFNPTSAFRALGALLIGCALFGPAIRPALADPALERIESTRTLRAGVVQFEPIVFKDTATGELKGFEVDAANLLAESMGVSLEFVETTWATAIAGLQTDKFDVIMVSMKRTIQRSMSVSFTDPYLSLIEFALVRDDAGISSWTDIDKDGNSITSVLGGAAHLKLQAGQDEYVQHAELLPFRDLTLCGNAVSGGQAVAWVDDIISISSYQKGHPETRFRLVEVPFAAHGEGNGMAVKHENRDLLNLLNIFVWKSQNDGTYARLAEKWGIPQDLLVPSVMTVK